MARLPDSSRCSVDALACDLANALVGLAENAGVVAAAQAAVGAEHQQQRVVHLLALFQQRMRDVRGRWR